MRDVGVLFAVLRSECDFGGSGNGTDSLEAPGEIGERIVQISRPRGSDFDANAGLRRGFGDG